jgi:hypothetical protein
MLLKILFGLHNKKIPLYRYFLQIKSNLKNNLQFNNTNSNNSKLKILVGIIIPSTEA